MSSNIVVTKGHHTCRNYGQNILHKAPFLSQTIEGRNTPFLGEGYYFWDNNIEQAKWWGETHYNNDYKIVEIDLELKSDEFIDLVGSRQDMMTFRQIIFELRKRLGIELAIGKCIEFLKIMKHQNKTTEDIFPYRVIRAVDLKQTPIHHRLKFSESRKDSYTNLCPTIIICFLDKESVPLQPRRLRE